MFSSLQDTVLEKTILLCVQKWFRWFSTDYTNTLPEGSVLVIATHPDDETIGCGASIARFCAEGRRVRLIVVTDGSASAVSAIISPDELSEIRRNETLKAAKILGLSSEDVFFLSYPDGQTPQYKKAISDAIAEHAQQFNPAIILAPHHLDEHHDHRTIAGTVGQLQNQKNFKSLILHYPIWYKAMSWPYGVMRCLISLSAYNRCRQFHAHDFIAQKKEALLQYRSQFENLTGEDTWYFFPDIFRKRINDSLELFFE